MNDEQERARDLRPTLLRLALPGLATTAALNRLIEKLDWSAQTRRRLLSGELMPEARPFCTTGYNPLGQARERFLAGDRDEAIWLHFAATLIGWDRPDSVDAFLRVLGAGARVTWREVAGDNTAVLSRLESAADVLMREAPFGNHRKYETHRGEHGSARVLASFLTWAGSSPAGRIDAIIAGARDPHDAFDRLYRSFEVYRFGRTARYDFFRLLANLDHRIEPGRCYLMGASGPRRGAALLFLGRPWARDSEIPYLEERARELARACRLDLQVIEDAVCQWQKAIPEARPASKLAVLAPAS
jgi:hypothetical protein